MGIHDRDRTRMRARFLHHGGLGFDDYQVLEMLLSSANGRYDTNPIAHSLIKKFGSLKAVLDADVATLTQVEGVGQINASIIKSMQIIANIYNNTSNDQAKTLKTHDEIGNYLCTKFANSTREHVYVVFMNDKNEVLELCKISQGDVISASVDIRRLLETAINSGAHGIVLAHNHPSGFALPSENDMATTDAIRTAMQFAGISVVDHIIVSNNDWVSLCESKLV